MVTHLSPIFIENFIVLHGVLCPLLPPDLVEADGRTVEEQVAFVADVLVQVHIAAEQVFVALNREGKVKLHIQTYEDNFLIFGRVR